MHERKRATPLVVRGACCRDVQAVGLVIILRIILTVTIFRRLRCQKKIIHNILHGDSVTIEGRQTGESTNVGFSLVVCATHVANQCTIGRMSPLHDWTVYAVVVIITGVVSVGQVGHGALCGFFFIFF